MAKHAQRLASHAKLAVAGVADRGTRSLPRPTTPAVSARGYNGIFRARFYKWIAAATKISDHRAQ